MRKRSVHYLLTITITTLVPLSAFFIDIRLNLASRLQSSNLQLLSVQFNPSALANNDSSEVIDEMKTITEKYFENIALNDEKLQNTLHESGLGALFEPQRLLDDPYFIEGDSILLKAKSAVVNYQLDNTRLRQEMRHTILALKTSDEEKEHLIKGFDEGVKITLPLTIQIMDNEKEVLSAIEAAYQTLKNNPTAWMIESDELFFLDEYPLVIDVFNTHLEEMYALLEKGQQLQDQYKQEQAKLMNNYKDFVKKQIL